MCRAPIDLHVQSQHSVLVPSILPPNHHNVMIFINALLCGFEWLQPHVWWCESIHVNSANEIVQVHKLLVHYCCPNSRTFSKILAKQNGCMSVFMLCSTSAKDLLQLQLLIQVWKLPLMFPLFKDGFWCS